MSISLFSYRCSANTHIVYRHYSEGSATKQQVRRTKRCPRGGRRIRTNDETTFLQLFIIPDASETKRFLSTKRSIRVQIQTILPSHCTDQNNKALALVAYIFYHGSFLLLLIFIVCFPSCIVKGKEITLASCFVNVFLVQTADGDLINAIQVFILNTLDGF